MSKTQSSDWKRHASILSMGSARTYSASDRSRVEWIRFSSPFRKANLAIYMKRHSIFGYNERLTILGRDCAGHSGGAQTIVPLNGSRQLGGNFSAGGILLDLGGGLRLIARHLSTSCSDDCKRFPNSRAIRIGHRAIFIVEQNSDAGTARGYVLWRLCRRVTMILPRRSSWIWPRTGIFAMLEQFQALSTRLISRERPWSRHIRHS